MDIKNIIVLPSYVVETLHAQDKGWIKFTNDIDSIFSTKEESTEQAVKLAEYFKANISKYDFEDTVACSTILNTHLGIKDLPLLKALPYIKDETLSRVVTSLADKDVDINKIILSNISNPDMNVPFSFRVSENCLYLILQNGFTNFIVYNITNFKFYFLQVLLNYLFKICGKKDVFRSSQFELVNRLVYKDVISKRA